MTRQKQRKNTRILIGKFKLNYQAIKKKLKIKVYLY